MLLVPLQQKKHQLSGAVRRHWCEKSRFLLAVWPVNRKVWGFEKGYRSAQGFGVIASEWTPDYFFLKSASCLKVLRWGGELHFCRVLTGMELIDPEKWCRLWIPIIQQDQTATGSIQNKFICSVWPNGPKLLFSSWLSGTDWAIRYLQIQPLGPSTNSNSQIWQSKLGWNLPPEWLCRSPGYQTRWASQTPVIKKENTHLTPGVTHSGLYFLLSCLSLYDSNLQKSMPWAN